MNPYLVVVLQGVEGEVALDAGHRPVVVLHLVLVLGDLGGGGRVVVDRGLTVALRRDDLLLGGGRRPPLLLLGRLLLQ